MDGTRIFYKPRVWLFESPEGSHYSTLSVSRSLHASQPSNEDKNKASFEGNSICHILDFKIDEKFAIN